MANDIIDTSRLDISDEQFLTNISSAGLTAMEYLTKLDAYEDKQEVKLYTSSVLTGLKQLSTGVYSPELVETLTANLEELKIQSENKDYLEAYRQGMDQVYHYGTLALESFKEREQMLTEAETQIKDRYDDYKIQRNNCKGSRKVFMGYGPRYRYPGG